MYNTVRHHGYELKTVRFPIRQDQEISVSTYWHSLNNNLLNFICISENPKNFQILEHCPCTVIMPNCLRSALEKQFFNEVYYSYLAVTYNNPTTRQLYIFLLDLL